MPLSRRDALKLGGPKDVVYIGEAEKVRLLIKFGDPTTDDPINSAPAMPDTA